MKYCPICGIENDFLSYGYVPRPNAKCPKCGSLERHRFVYFLYSILFLKSSKTQRVLHFAPEKCISGLFLENPLVEYVPADLNPERYDFLKNVLKLDACNIDMPDCSFDVVLANHLMEHLPDDKKFIRECLRVLKPSGILIFTVPFDSSRDETYEDPSIDTAEGRRLHFLQEDHLRLYGNDVIKRFESEKCTISEIKVSDVFPEFIRDKLALYPDRAYVVRPD